MFEKIRLSNGLIVVLINISQVRSLAIGVWVKAGVVSENQFPNGISHFTEHMLFKGTKKRSSKEIAKQIEDIGGEINAFTSREFTCLYTRSLDEYSDICIDILSDIFFNSTFDPIEIEKEKNVIRQEIAMYEDTPDELIHDLIIQTMWSNSSYGKPVAGTKESIEKIDHDSITSYVKNSYDPKNTVISISGNIDKEKIIDNIQKSFVKGQTKITKNTFEIQTYTPNVLYRKKDTEQNHICIGFKSYDIFDEKNYSMSCFNSMFGSGMSSMLFQRIREELGLVYSVYAYSSVFSNGGSFIIYAGLDKANTKVYLNEIKDMISNFKNIEITEKELSILKNKLRSNYILALESPTSLMNYAGSNEILKGYIRTTDEISEKIDQITLDSMFSSVEEVFNGEKSIVLIGEYNDELSKYM